MGEREDIDNKIKELFNQNLSNSEIADSLNIGVGRVKSGLGRLKLKRTKEQNRAILSRRLKESYKAGVSKPLKGKDNPFSKPDIKEKIKEYNLTHKDELKTKREKTCLERYGVKNVFELKSVQDRIKQTNLQKYGTTSPMKNPEVANKTRRAIKQTLKLKYNHPEIVKKVISKSKELGRKLTPKEFIQITGKTQANAYLLMHNYRLEKYVELKIIEFEEDLKKFLYQYHIQYQTHNRQILKPQEIDIYLPDYKLGIEANDLATHNSTYGSYRGSKPKESNYHINKTNRSLEKGIRLLHIWDYEWYDDRKRPILESLILSRCGVIQKIWARKCQVEIKNSTDTKEFFEKNHLDGYVGGKVAICLVYNGEIVMAWLFGHNYYGKGKYEWEVKRAATKRGHQVVGGASRIWRHFMDEYSPKSCVFYVDRDHYDGHSLEGLGFKFVKNNPHQKIYLKDEDRITGRQPSKNKEIKELISKNKAWEIWTSGVGVYAWSSNG